MTLQKKFVAEIFDILYNYWYNEELCCMQVFSSLYHSEGLSDVTLVCGDGSIKAHKLLLSTCSDYFLVNSY
jgi:hypothetical protein